MELIEWEEIQIQVLGNGPTNQLIPHKHSLALPTAISLPTLASPTRKLTGVRGTRPAKPSTSTAGTKDSTPTVTMTVDIYPDIVKCASPVPLDESSYTTAAEKNPYFPHLEPLDIPPSKTLPLQRPTLQRGPSSNLVTRWNRVDVPDSVLIAELEELRRSVELANGNSPSDDHYLVSDSRCNSCTYGSSSPDDDRRWRKAQKSAFCRRELIKTELTYLEGILQLENKDASEFTNLSQFEMLILLVSITAARSPLGLPPIFNCRLLPAT